MWSVFHSLSDYAILSGKETLKQLFLLFGPLLVLSLLMNYLSVINYRLSIKVFGEKGYLWLFGWLGVSVHELGHAVFALAFGHRIKEIKLFKPDPKTGTLGYVSHTYNPKNLFHQTGNFFIGIGPILLGGTMLFLLILLLFKLNMFHYSQFELSYSTMLSFESIKSEIKNIAESTLSIFSELFRHDYPWWKVAIFLYCLLAIGSAIKLSPPDLTSSAQGFLFILLLLLTINLTTVWNGTITASLVECISHLSSGFYFIMILSVLINFFLVLALSIIYLFLKGFGVLKK